MTAQVRPETVLARTAEAVGHQLDHWSANQGAAPVATSDAMRGMQVEVYDTTSKLHVVRPVQNLDMLLLNKDAGHLITGI